METWYEIEINLSLTIDEDNWFPILHYNEPMQWDSLHIAINYRNNGNFSLIRSRIVKVEGGMVEKSREVCLQ
jgi:hypothetical protein